MRKCWCNEEGCDRDNDHLTIEEKFSHAFTKAPQDIKRLLYKIYIYQNKDRTKFTPEEYLKAHREFNEWLDIVKGYDSELTISDIPEEMKKMIVPGVDFTTLDNYEKAIQLEI